MTLKVNKKKQASFEEESKYGSSKQHGLSSMSGEPTLQAFSAGTMAQGDQDTSIKPALSVQRNPGKDPRTVTP